MSAERFRRPKGDPYPGFTRIGCDWRDHRGDPCLGTYFDASDAASGRRYAQRELGWVRVDGKDFCPAHTPEGKP